MPINLRRFASDPLAFFDALTIPSAHGNAKFIEVMADYQRDWFKAIIPSMLAVAAGSPPPIGRYWLERTKGGSKDSDAACVLLWLLAFSRVKLDMQVGAADKDQAHELKKAAADIIHLNGWLAERVEVQSWTLLCKATGSECTIIAADVAGSHGARPSVLLLNELSHIQKEEFASNLMDNATKKPQGLLIVATNSGFRGTWQERWRNIARESERWHFHTFSQPAPWLSDAEIDEAKRRNSNARFNRLFWGHWPSQSGDALDEQDILACIDNDLAPMAKQADWIYVGGLDLSVTQDHSALVIVGANRRTQEMQLACCESWAADPKTRKVNLMQIEATCLAMHERYELTALGYDPFQAALMSQRLQLQNVPMHEMNFVGANLNLMASTLMETFRSRKLRMYNAPDLIRDLGRLTIVEKSYGYKLEAVKDTEGHADRAIALAIALPIVIEELGDPPLIVGALDLDAPEDGEFDSPLLRHFQQRARELDEDQEELKLLWKAGADLGGLEEFTRMMQKYSSRVLRGQITTKDLFG